MARYIWVGVILAILGVASAAQLTYATDAQSSHYQIDESSVGTGGLYGASSADYQANSSTGDIAVGSSSSTSFQVDAGTKTQRDPTLSFSVNTTAAQFGKLSPTQATTAISSFTVSNYTSYGYVVQIYGQPPSDGNHTLAAMATSDVSKPGTEQFGVNLVANTSPISFGANPDNGQFGYGSVNANYNTPNQFRYVSGDTIASANESSGDTTYTISYLVNVSSLTPGGAYTSNETLIVTGTY